MSNKLYIFENGKRIKALKDIACPVCKKLFSPRTSKDKYCSRPCYYQMKKIRGDYPRWTQEMKESLSIKYQGTGNPMFGKISKYRGKKRPEFSGSKHWNYKGGYITKDGYLSICVNGKEIGLHKYLLEIKLGRKLTKNEVAHHIDGNKLNNDINNIQLMTRSEHIKHHRKQLEDGKINKMHKDGGLNAWVCNRLVK